MHQPDSSTTRLAEYIAAVLPWAHGHQRKAITTYVAQILEKQTGCQAPLARGLGNQEAACKRLSRLLHNPRLDPKHLAEAVLWQAISQLPGSGLPGSGPVRLAIDWTTEGEQHLLVVSLIVGRRAVPIYWRAYHSSVLSSVLKGRMQRYALAVVRRALTALQGAVGKKVRWANAACSSRRMAALPMGLYLNCSMSCKWPSSSVSRAAPKSVIRGAGVSSTGCGLWATLAAATWAS